MPEYGSVSIPQEAVHCGAADGRGVIGRHAASGARTITEFQRLFKLARVRVLNHLDKFFPTSKKRHVHARVQQFISVYVFG